MPRTPPPPGYVGGLDAVKLLASHGVDISTSMFYKLVGNGRITGHGPRKHKYYSVQELERYAAAERGGAHIDLAFSRAGLDDLEGITAVSRKLFKSPHAPYIPTETRRAWLIKEPRGHYIIKRPTGEVVAWLHIVALTDETIKRYMAREVYGRDLTADDVQVYVPGVPQSCIVLSVGVDPDLDQGRRDGKKPLGSRCMSILLHGVQLDLSLLGLQGIIIEKLYAWSETNEGIAMCAKFGMQQYAQPYKPKDAPRRYTFYLDVQQSTMPLVRGYQQALREWRSLQHRPMAVARAERKPSAPRPERAAPISRPPDTITLQELADELGLSRTTLLGHVKDERKQLAHIAIPKPGREHEHERYFTPEQAQTVRAWHQAHSKKKY